MPSWKELSEMINDCILHPKQQTGHFLPRHTEAEENDFLLNVAKIPAHSSAIYRPCQGAAEVIEYTFP